MKKSFLLKLIIFQISNILLVLGVCICIGSSVNYLKYNHKIYKNIQIGHINLGGKTIEEAHNVINSQLINPILNQELILQINETSINLPLQDFYITSNLDELLEDVATYSSNLSFEDKWQHLNGSKIYNLDLYLDFDEHKMITHAENFISSFNTLPADANIYIDNLGQITTTSHTNGKAIDTEQLLIKLTDVFENYSPTLPITSNIILDLSSELNVSLPSITADDLKLINAVVSSYTTNFSASATNGTNITLAAQAINGTLLMPGEIFSFNELVGDTTLDKGYVSAPIIANGKLTQGVGGGICQVSSTLYNAILALGITPLERSPHSKPISYVPLGLDSTIDWGNIDLKFENTLDYPIYISSFTDNGKLHIDLYSNEALLENSYTLSSEVIKTLPSSVKYIKDSSLNSGTKVLVSSGDIGYLVKVTRTTYKNDEVVGSEVISLDTYSPTATVYRIG